MHSIQVNIHTVLVIKLLHTVLARVHKGVGEVLALNVHEKVVLACTDLLADGALVLLALGVVRAVLLHSLSEVTLKLRNKLV